MQKPCGHTDDSNLCDDLCAKQNLPPSPEHNYVTLENGERFCPTYIYGGSMGEVCTFCGFEPPSMSDEELKKRTITRERLSVNVFFESNETTQVMAEILTMVADELGAEAEGKLFGRNGEGASTMDATDDNYCGACGEANAGVATGCDARCYYDGTVVRTPDGERGIVWSKPNPPSANMVWVAWDQGMSTWCDAANLERE